MENRDSRGVWEFFPDNIRIELGRDRMRCYGSVKGKQLQRIIIKWLMANCL